jgi:Putative Ig domain
MTKRNSLMLLLVACLFVFSLLTTSCGSGSLSNIGGNSNGGGGTNAPEITTASLPAGTVGTAYSTDLKATGGKVPYIWSVKSGTLPTGLSLSADGAISGTPTIAETGDALIFAVTDANKSTASSGNLGLKINSAAPPVVRTTSLPNGTVGYAYAASLQATGGKPPYSWSVKSGTLPAGVSLNVTGALAGTPTASGDFGSLVFAVSDANRSVGDSRDVAVFINPAPVPQITTTTLPTGMVGTSYAFTLQATGGSSVYTWSVQSGTLPSGLSLNSATGAISGTPTKAGIFTPLVFKVTDADTASAESSDLSLQVYDVHACSAGAESNLGTQSYAFLIKGFDSHGPVTMIGSFTPNGTGGITGGGEDINRSTGAQKGLSINGATSSYTLGADNNGCLTLANSAGATTTFRFAVGGLNGAGAFTTGHIIEFDDNSGTGTRGSGILRLQNSSSFGAGLQGMYAFQLTGTNAGSGHFGLTGSLQASGGNFNQTSLDFDNAGSIWTNVTGVTGSYSGVDANGRGTASFAATGYSLDTVFYIVSANEALFASADPLAINPISSGEALSTSGPFSAANLINNYVAHGIGYSVNGPVAMIAAASFNGVNAITSGYITQDRGGAVSTGVLNATYTVDSVTGRVSFSEGGITPVAYLVTNVPGVNAFLIGNDFPATSGVLEAQTGANPSTGIFLVGTDEITDYETAELVGTLDLTAQNFSGTVNLDNSTVPYLVMNQPVTPTAFTFGTGGGTFGPNTGAVTSGSAVYFIEESTGITHPSVIAVTQ